MKNFLVALQFLTIIPLKPRLAIDKDGLTQATIYFPLIGLALGLILAGLNQLLSFIFLPQLLVNVILITMLVVLTGGLHLDGLADTFDALGSRKSKSQMLEIMRDAHIGVMGVLSLICLMLWKIGLMSALKPQLFNIGLILMCLLSRYALVLAIFLFPYAREEGKAKAFFAGMNPKVFSLATAITLVCALSLAGLKGLIPFATVVFFVFLAGKFISQKIGGLTGDTLGAINELSEVLVLVSMLLTQ